MRIIKKNKTSIISFVSYRSEISEDRENGHCEARIERCLGHLTVVARVGRCSQKGILGNPTVTGISTVILSEFLLSSSITQPFQCESNLPKQPNYFRKNPGGLLHRIFDPGRLKISTMGGRKGREELGSDQEEKKPQNQLPHGSYRGSRKRTNKGHNGLSGHSDLLWGQ